MDIVNCKDCNNENCKDSGNDFRSMCWAYKKLDDSTSTVDDVVNAGDEEMSYYDKITFYACVFFLLLLGFAGGLLTALGVVFMVWRWII